MSQHAYTIANQAGAAFRADVVNAFQAGTSNNIGATAPATLYAGMWWLDTTSGWAKQRNAANSAWNKKIPLDAGARVDVASAATLDLDAAAVTSDYLRLTGTTGVTAVTLADGQRRIAVAGGAVPITHGASLILPGAANYTCAAGDLLLFIGEAAGVVRVMIWKADGTPVVGTTFASSAENAAGTLENKAVDPLGIREAFNATGAAPVYACRAWVTFDGTGTPSIGASGNVTSITDNGTADYTVNFTTAMVDANYCVNVMGARGDTVNGVGVQYRSGTAPVAGSVRVILMIPTTGAISGTDPSLMCVSIFR